VCCSVLQCFAVFHSVLMVGWLVLAGEGNAVMCYSVLQCVAVCCSVLQRVVVRCGVLQCVDGWVACSSR